LLRKYAMALGASNGNHISAEARAGSGHAQ
jgi:hypothetical protein